MELEGRAGQAIKHPIYGKGKIIKITGTLYTIHFPNRGNLDISGRTEGLELLEEESQRSDSGEEISVSQVEKSLRKILSEYSDIQQIVPIGERWQGGKLIIQPADETLKSKEIPLETFFHKIVMVRDRLRVLEQQINANAKLNDAEKVDFQQYITRIYGSLTTFNLLFKENSHHFVGEKKSQ